jgi:hypothetical protein
LPRSFPFDMSVDAPVAPTSSAGYTAALGSVRLLHSGVPDGALLGRVIQPAFYTAPRWPESFRSPR